MNLSNNKKTIETAEKIIKKKNFLFKLASQSTVICETISTVAPRHEHTTTRGGKKVYRGLCNSADR